MKSKFKIIFMVLFTAGYVIFAGQLYAQEPEAGKMPKIGLVLSGGGAKGLAHIGVLKVLEEAGVELDFIAGTSMGGIIGGLYAIGHNSGRLKKIALEQDWDELIYDRIPRNSLSIDEKDEDERHVIAFPIRKRKLALPIGLVTGHNLSVLLSRLCWSVHHVENFSDFPIPFLCVATDVETGEAVEFNRGYLPDVFRATMSIPTAFTPARLNGRLLIDGGIVKNLPVSNIRKMGADLVIGVDVGAPLYEKDELNSMARILNQTISFLGVNSTEEQKKICDIVISPDLKEFTMLSFDEAETLISIGEQAARKFLPRLKELAESQKKFREKVFKHIPLSTVESIKISELRIEGLEKVSKSLLLGKLNLKIPCSIKPEDLEKAIDRAYGSKYFESVTYKFIPGSGGVVLILRIVEKSTDFLKLGVHYDGDMKSAVLLNTTFRNVWGQGSKLLFDLKLGDNPSFRGSYFRYTNWKPGIGIGLSMLYNNYEGFSYKNGVPDASYDISDFWTNFELKTIFSNSFEMGGGMQHGYFNRKPKVAPQMIEDIKNEFLNFFVFIAADTYNKKYYPEKGIKFYAETRVMYDDIKIKGEELSYNSFRRYKISLCSALPLYSKLTLLNGITFGILNGENIHSNNLFYLGGQTACGLNFIPFTGRRFMEVPGKNVFIVTSGFQFEPWKNRYLIIKGNLGNASSALEDLLKTESMISGISLTAAVNTPVGPVEYSLLWGSKKKGAESYVKIGFSF